MGRIGWSEKGVMIMICYFFHRSFFERDFLLLGTVLIITIPLSTASILVTPVLISLISWLFQIYTWYGSSLASTATDIVGDIKRIALSPVGEIFRMEQLWRLLDSHSALLHVS